MWRSAAQAHAGSSSSPESAARASGMSPRQGCGASAPWEQSAPGSGDTGADSAEDTGVPDAVPDAAVPDAVPDAVVETDVTTDTVVEADTTPDAGIGKLWDAVRYNTMSTF